MKTILFITQTRFLALLGEKLFKSDDHVELYARTEIDDVLYLIRDLNIDLLFLDIDDLTQEFWSELMPLCDGSFKIVFTGRDLDKAPVKADKILKKPLDASRLKEELTILCSAN